MRLAWPSWCRRGHGKIRQSFTNASFRLSSLLGWGWKAWSGSAIDLEASSQGLEMALAANRKSFLVLIFWWMRAVVPPCCLWCFRGRVVRLFLLLTQQSDVFPSPCRRPSWQGACTTWAWRAASCSWTLSPPREWAHWGKPTPAAPMDKLRAAAPLPRRTRGIWIWRRLRRRCRKSCLRPPLSFTRFVSPRVGVTVVLQYLNGWSYRTFATLQEISSAQRDPQKLVLVKAGPHQGLQQRFPEGQIKMKEPLQKSSGI